MNILFFEEMTKGIFNIIVKTVYIHRTIELHISKPSPIPLISKYKVLLIRHP